MKERAGRLERKVDVTKFDIQRTVHRDILLQ